jgi:ABC transport system ATP-binding/permease protein
MALVSVQDVSIAFGRPAVLEHATLHIEKGERVCLLGRNGAGKSTLLRALQGDIAPDDGEIVRRAGLRAALLAQEVPEGLEGTVFDIVAAGVPIARESPDGAHHDEVWRVPQKVESVLSRMELDPRAVFEQLSAGLKRRALLARALAGEPDLLLLDEPTNHFDIDAICWLEDFLLRFNGTTVFVTHDRAFLRKLATRIVDVERGRLTSYACDYDTYIERKEDELAAEEAQQATFDKKLAQEEVWVRQGVKARRTRNMGRVRALEHMREERRDRRERAGSVQLLVQEAERSGRLVARVEDVSFGYGETRIVRDFSTTILRGDKVGIIGPNGSGKTSLLRLLLGELAPDRGTVHLGTRLEVVYFDQLRAQLDEDKTAVENVDQGREMLTIDGRPRHVLSYLSDFLFPADRARTLVRVLSGGERNRLLLARLFTQPCNLLVMDEPTNDLDLETLELLEELLVAFTGTLLLVTHDRTFLTNVVTSTLLLEGDGRVGEYVGGYDEVARRRASEAPARPRKAAVPAKKERARAEGPRKLSYKEQRELEALPARIDALEAEERALHDAMADPAFYRQDGAEIARKKARLDALELELAECYRRWEELEAG